MVISVVTVILDDSIDDQENGFQIQGNSMNAKANTRWQKPGQYVVKINWDATMDVKKKKVGFGIIARDFEGEVMASLCARYNYLLTRKD